MVPVTRDEERMLYFHGTITETDSCKDQEKLKHGFFLQGWFLIWKKLKLPRSFVDGIHALFFKLSRRIVMTFIPRAAGCVFWSWDMISVEAQNNQLNAERARFSLKCVRPDFLIPWFRCGESGRICGDYSDYRLQSV